MINKVIFINGVTVVLLLSACIFLTRPINISDQDPLHKNTLTLSVEHFWFFCLVVPQQSEN